MNKYNKKYEVISYAFLSMVLLPSTIFAEKSMKGFLTELTGWLVSELGEGLMILGVIVAGISYFLANNERWTKAGIQAVVAGVVIFLAKTVIGKFVGWVA
ncbi:MAG: TrbC/VirB2 family protein [Candidatus Margulisbacteria bacterium]|nr:TrbC/VirB2 family protein [Candidatus Margulisiibacteriota bacterium]